MQKKDTVGDVLLVREQGSSEKSGGSSRRRVRGQQESRDLPKKVSLSLLVSVVHRTHSRRYPCGGG